MMNVKQCIGVWEHVGKIPIEIKLNDKWESAYVSSMYPTTYEDENDTRMTIVFQTTKGLVIKMHDALNKHSTRWRYAFNSHKYDYEKQIDELLKPYPTNNSAFVNEIKGTIDSWWTKEYEPGINDQFIFKDMLDILTEMIEGNKELKTYVRVKPEIQWIQAKKHAYFRLQFIEEEGM